VRSIRLAMAVSILLGVVFTALPAEGQSSGDSVNIVSGTGWTNGDPFLRRQNEPSLAVSTRNTLHLLGGTNGLFFYSGIAFNRGTNAPGVVFVARFIDNDNKENGDATRTEAYIFFQNS